MQRALGRDVIAIADALNYIKGVRYQLHCEAKAAGTPSCVVHVGTPVATCRAINDAVRAGRAPTVVRGEVVPADAGDAARPEGAAGAASAEADAPPTAAERAHGDAPGADAAAAPEDGAGGGYDPELFDNLVYRYEEPDGRARWDRPLFTVLADDPAPPYDAIWDALVVRPGGGRAKAVRPNQATVLVRAILSLTSSLASQVEAAGRSPTSFHCGGGAGGSPKLTRTPWQAPAAAPDALHELDRSTAAVAAALGAHLAEHPGESGGAVAVPGAAEAVRLPAGARPVTAPQVQRLRREFVALWRGHGAGIAAARAADGFVRFLNAKWEAE